MKKSDRDTSVLIFFFVFLSEIQKNVMKQTLLLFFVFFAGYGLFSQNFVIEFKGENVILAGVPQKLDVLPMNASVGKLSYSMTNGTVAETDSGIYTQNG